MSLALISSTVMMTKGSADEGASPRLGRLAGTDVAATMPARPRIDMPPLPEVYEEQDPERWDGMA